MFLLEPRKVLPILKTDEPKCPDNQLQCGNGECINKDLFCNDKPDCTDESDENACSKYIFIILYLINILISFDITLYTGSLNDVLI